MSDTDTEQTWRFTDKSKWPSGPWDSEPDKVQWVDEKTGLDCLIVRNHLGALCGYVGVPEGHPLFAKDDSAIDHDLRVHGGLTFSSFCQEAHGEESHARICHVPLPGRPDRVWWLGFDCAHLGDHIPSADSYRRGFDGSCETYKDISYVKTECANGLRKLAIAQLGSSKIDDAVFLKELTRLTIRKLVPIALRAAASIHKEEKHKTAMEASAVKCETDEDYRAASSASDSVLTAAAEIGVEALKICGSPGCEWLDLVTDEPVTA